MSSDSVINLKKVSKTYTLYSSPIHRMLALLLNKTTKHSTRVEALQPLDLKVSRGETLAVIGRNGSGKSTLLQIMTGILQPSTGCVKSTGRIAALLELGAGFNPEFTGRENIYLSAALHGLSQHEIETRIGAILEFAEIDDFIDHPVKTYSSGMYVRLAFSLIAHLDAEILIIDEALAVGDVYFTQKCARFLREFKSKGTLIFVSHDTHSVINLCDRALWLEKGRMMMLGSSREVCEAYITSLHLSHTETTQQGIRTQGEFGTGKVKINNCRLLDSQDQPLLLLNHAQQVTVEVSCTASEIIEAPIMGFFVRDKIGQPILGENTLNQSSFKPLPANRSVTLYFSFKMPLLETGDYTLGVAIGSGNQLEHIQHHWIYEAFSFKSEANPYLTGQFQLEQLAFHTDY